MSRMRGRYTAISSFACQGWQMLLHCDFGAKEKQNIEEVGGLSSASSLSSVLC